MNSNQSNGTKETLSLSDTLDNLFRDENGVLQCCSDCSNDSNDSNEEEATIDEITAETTEMTLEQCQDMASGMLDVIFIRLQCANESILKSHLATLWKHKKYVQFLTLTRVLNCHFKTSHSLLSECFEQLSDLVNSIVDELGLRNDPDYLYYSLEGALGYINYCFRDDKLTNSHEVTGMLYKQFMESLEQRNYYKMYGMLLSFQTLFQYPDKTVVYDIIYEHLILLCPELEDGDDESG